MTHYITLLHMLQNYICYTSIYCHEKRKKCDTVNKIRVVVSWHAGSQTVASRFCVILLRCESAQSHFCHINQKYSHMYQELTKYC